MINEKDLAGLTNRLQVPSAVQDILDGREELTPDVHYGLHEVLSDTKPDAALLSIAFSAHKIASQYEELSSSLVVLKMEALRILDEYAPLWLSHARDGNVDEVQAYALLEHLPEDLEALGELLENGQAYLSMRSMDAAELAKILSVQAHTQSLIAESYVEMMNGQEDKTDSAPANDIAVLAAVDNVIQFPGRV